MNLKTNIEQEKYDRVVRRLVRKVFGKLDLWKYFEGYDPLYIYDCQNAIIDEKEQLYIDNYIKANIPKKFRRVNNEVC